MFHTVTAAVASECAQAPKQTLFHRWAIGAQHQSTEKVNVHVKKMFPLTTEEAVAPSVVGPLILQINELIYINIMHGF